MARRSGTTWELIRLLLQSFGVALGASLLAVGAGAVVALAAIASRPRIKLFWQFTGIAVLMLPQFIVASSWLEWATRWHIGPSSSAEIQSFIATAAALASFLWPIPAGLIYYWWVSLAPELLEIDPRLRDGIFVKNLLIRVAWGSAALSGCICFGLALSNFTIPTLFQVPVYTERIWLAFSVRLDAFAALTNALPSIFTAMAFVVLSGCYGTVYPWPTADGRRSDLLRSRLGRSRVWAIVGGVLVVGVTLIWPLWTWLAPARTWLELGSAWGAGESATRHSVVLAACAATLALACGVFIGARVYSRRKAALVATRLSWLAFLVPGVVLGIVINKSISPWSGDSQVPVIISLVVRYLGFSLSGMVAVYHSLDRGQSDSVRLVSGGAWTHWRIAVWPQARGRILTIWYITYLLSLWDVETVTLLAPPGGETLALRIFNLLHYGHASQVKALCVILTGTGLFPAVIFQLVSLTARMRMRHTTRRDS